LLKSDDSFANWIWRKESVAREGGAKGFHGRTSEKIQDGFHDVCEVNLCRSIDVWVRKGRRRMEEENDPVVNELSQRYHSGDIDGHTLAEMVDKGELTKSQRRKIVKVKKQLEKDQNVELSERQKLRLAIKEKKSRPKLTKEERKKKFQSALLDQEREDTKSKFAVCLGCRKRGHLLKNCPDAKKEVGICFNCGSSGHALRACPKPRGPVLKFAKCFICGNSGHISRECPENANGLYPRGGCCHICLQKTHLVKDCPERTEEDAAKYRKRKLDEEDAELGPRIGEVVDSVGGGDDYEPVVASTNNFDEDVDEEESQKPKKKKKKASKN
jgi:hypothetical protein